LSIRSDIILLESSPPPREAISIEDTQPHDMPVPVILNNIGQSIKILPYDFHKQYNIFFQGYLINDVKSDENVAALVHNDSDEIMTLTTNHGNNLILYKIVLMKLFRAN
jgi:hypothetical protein